MKLDNRKRMIANMLGIGIDRIKFDNSRISEIKDAITKADLRVLIQSKAIIIKPKKGTSRARARKLLLQKRKGRRSGRGSKKGKKRATLPKKRAWINRVRIQREFLRNLRDKKLISTKTYRLIYRKISGGFFRSKNHLKLYLQERNLFENGKK
jgi:large subunit ribosomal protein L19e